ncbi:urease accessory protein UreD [Actinokineospora iranica]|uniref:Urease accessory protein UreD n=1 Tax=Actinokineospora iranica TaxID=1271860 RepID=A0A1G6S6A5_9PSEU|nr:urease accessory protein UreD [Actinokineospora iranica]SDD11726.1 urease accessory protein [Actinokineospora iranica]
MKARARLVVERDSGGASVVRELRSMSPLTLLPCPPSLHDGDPDTALVHLAGSAATPLGGDVLDLAIVVGPGARLRLVGVGATLALPGQHPGPSTMSVTIEVGAAGSLEYLTEPTIVVSAADHHADLRADLAADARLRCREVVVLGRSGERPGAFHSETRLRRDGTTLLRQRLDLGGALDATPTHLAGHPVIATELLVWGADPAEAAVGDWWSLVPLAHGGSLATVLAEDTITAYRRLDTATAAHPGLAEPAAAVPVSG